MRNPRITGLDEGWRWGAGRRRNAVIATALAAMVVLSAGLAAPSYDPDAQSFTSSYSDAAAGGSS